MTEPRELLEGATAIARGALAAGCNFFAGYPITPASGILVHMLRELPKVGGIGIQAEDEIASMGLCIGAALAGAKAMTASSGPGLSLYSENIGVAIMVQVPLVVVIVQRMGPATGAATTGAQGDVQFLRWCTSGGYPIIALTPTNAVDSYHLTQRAFALAERYRSPVFLATDKEVAMTTETVAVDAFRTPPPWCSPLPTEPLVPPLVPFSAGLDAPPDSLLLRYNASSHDEAGYITKDPAVLERLNQQLAAKIDAHASELELAQADLQPGAETLLIGYGVTARSVREATRLARSQGFRVSALTIYSLWPVPQTAILGACDGVRRVVVAELNLGQYRREVERLVCGRAEVIGVHRLDGLLISPRQLLEAVAVP